MSLSKAVALSTFLAANVSFAQNCNYLARDLQDSIRHNNTAALELDRSLYGMSSLVDALNEAARLVGSGSGSVDLRGELYPLVSDTEGQVRSSQGPLSRGLSELRRTITEPDLGSEAYRIAGRVADMHNDAKNITQTAERSVNPLRERIARVSSDLKDNSQLRQARQRIVSELRSLSQIERSISGLQGLERMQTLARDYTYSCAQRTDYRCRDLRTEMNRSADRCRYAGRELERNSYGLRQQQNDIQRLADALVRTGNVPDVNGILNGILDRDVVPQIQDEFNNLSVSSDHARRASTASSGVEFDRLVRDICIPSSEKAERLSQAALSGLNSLRSNIDSLARQIGSGSSVRPEELQRAASEVQRLGSTLAASSDELSGRRGELSRLSGALDEHQRYCY